MFFNKLKENLKKTKESLDIKMSNIFSNKKDIEEVIDEIEETLILSDVGFETSTKICNNLRKDLKKQLEKDEKAIKTLLRKEMTDILMAEEIDKVDSIELNQKQVILVVGVNGVGKTTSIGKLTKLYTKAGKKVLLAAADTFRAGAIEQLEVWAQRNNVDIVTGKEMQDPASVIFDATKKFSESGTYDVLICDTAGRLHNKKNLMDELEKMKKIIDKNIGEDIHKETIMVLDATTGQNGAIQAKLFTEKTDVSGIFLTKLDSTAKGGVVFSIVDELKIPVKYIGVGEQIDDIEKFDAKAFVEAII
ncbi:MAG: signal recognition particle-docking protein FtsY [Clostridia bacterium]|nr:signal recognition particle-docking protein FtsY [Clostridia bacterium]